MRTSDELNKVIKDFEDKCIQKYITKKPLGEMMTRKDKLEHAKLIRECYETMKAEGKL